LNSLFKVLFNFPLRYLLTIGLVPVFSLRWSLPPALGCIPKKPDCGKSGPRRGGGRYRPATEGKSRRGGTMSAAPENGEVGTMGCCKALRRSAEPPSPPRPSSPTQH